MKAYAAREEAFGLQPDGTPLMRELERVVMLRVDDDYWMDHHEAMDDLRQGIGLRAYGNVKPVDEYKRAGFDMFDEMVNGIQSETVRRLFTVRVRREQKLERKTVARSAATNAGGTSAPATVSITVSPAPPVANAVSATVAYGSSGNAITLNINSTHTACSDGVCM